MGLALPIIGVLSMIGWFGAWQLGALIVRFFS
jgi:cell division protein FtsX